MAKRPNIVFLMSDQHRADVLGAADNRVVRTPNLDQLADDGVLFEQAYCQGPLCVPARASLLTERYVRDHGATENDHPAAYGELPTFVQAIRDAGYDTAAVGKMHLVPHSTDVQDNFENMQQLGFTEVDEEVGKLAAGWVGSGYTRYLSEHNLLETYREFVNERHPLLRLAPDPASRPIRPMWTAESSPLPPRHYIDSYVGRRAAEWINSRSSDDPFFLWVGFPGPHDPWDAPESYVNEYLDRDIPLDVTTRPEIPDDGPLRNLVETFLNYSSSETLTNERIRNVRRHYYANVTLIDEAIGCIQNSLRSCGLDEDTWIIYTSDHGEMLGTHGLLNKMVFYDPAVRVPLIIRPPHRPATQRVDGMVEHVDLSATMRGIAGAGTVPGSAGRSLYSESVGFDIEPRGVVVSENFGFGMWRTDRYKLVVYERDELPVQLFDLECDPAEVENLVDLPTYRPVVDDLLVRYVSNFLATPPVRKGPDLVERGGRLGLQGRTETPGGR